MLGRRYPYVPAGKVAAAVFGAAGLIAGWLLSYRAFSGVPAWLNAVLWAGVAAVTAFIVFASQGPPRPASVTQAAIADGVVAGIITSISAALLSTLIGHGAGTATSSLSLANFAASVAGGAAGGAVGGAALGWLALLTGGRDRLSRPQAGTSRRSRRSSRSRRRK